MCTSVYDVVYNHANLRVFTIHSLGSFIRSRVRDAWIGINYITTFALLERCCIQGIMARTIGAPFTIHTCK